VAKWLTETSRYCRSLVPSRGPRDGTLKAWASAIRYRTKDRKQPAKPLGRDLLDWTSSGDDDVLDVVLGDYATLGAP
jgi:hypothetical protein